MSLTGALLPSPATCAVPGCDATSLHASDFAEVTFAPRFGAPRRVRVCVECLEGRTRGLPALSWPCVAALGALYAAAVEAPEAVELPADARRAA